MTRSTDFESDFSNAQMMAERKAIRDLPRWRKRMRRAIRRGESSVGNRSFFFWRNNGRAEYIFALQQLLPEMKVREANTHPEDCHQTVTMVEW
jgi:hypothetical protein